MSRKLTHLDPTRPPLRWLLDLPEVLAREAESGGFFIASAWGARAQWLRNLEASSGVEVQVGRQRFPAEVARLSEDGGADQLRRCAKHHPWAYRHFIGPLLLGRRPCELRTDVGGFAASRLSVYGWSTAGVR